MYNFALVVYVCWGNLRERDHMEDPEVDGMKILDGSSGNGL
jgi:hypothetical protein